VNRQNAEITIAGSRDLSLSRVVLRPWRRSKRRRPCRPVSRHWGRLEHTSLCASQADLEELCLRVVDRAPKRVAR